LRLERFGFASGSQQRRDIERQILVARVIRKS